MNLLSSPDGELQFLMGRCYEENKGGSNRTRKCCVNVPKSDREQRTQRIEAGERCATLLRDKLQQPKEAEQVINSLVDEHHRRTTGVTWHEGATGLPSQLAISHKSPSH